MLGFFLVSVFYCVIAKTQIELVEFLGSRSKALKGRRIPNLQTHKGTQESSQPQPTTKSPSGITG